MFKLIPLKEFQVAGGFCLFFCYKESWCFFLKIIIVKEKSLFLMKMLLT